MFDFLRKKTTLLPEEPKPKIVKPAYERFVSHENISKLKVDMINKVASMQPPNVPTELEKEAIISDLIEKLPILLVGAIERKSKVVYIFGSAIDMPYNKIMEYGGADAVMLHVIHDLLDVLEAMGLQPTIPTQAAICMETDKLMKWCNYEKMSLIK